MRIGVFAFKVSVLGILSGVIEEILLSVRPTMYCKVCFLQDLGNDPLMHVFPRPARIGNLYTL